MDKLAPRHEVPPYATDTWSDEISITVGCKYRINGYFYKLEPLGSLEELRTGILRLEKKSKGPQKAVRGETNYA